MVRRVVIAMLGGVAAAAVGWAVAARSDRGPAVIAPRGVLRVLAVGVGRYRDVPDLTYPARDAAAVAGAFQARAAGLFRRIETRLLIDDQGDRRGFVEGLEWLRAESRPEDASVIYYGGHGGNDPPVGFYLAPGLFRDRFWRRTMITGDDLRTRVAAIPGRVVVLLDTCYAGAILDQAPDLKDGRAAYLVATRAGESNRGTGVDRSRRCDFTQALLEALDGREGADADGDGAITLDELGRHVARRVLDRRLGWQRPVLDVPPPLRKLALSRPG
jgi:Caspase domain